MKWAMWWLVISLILKKNESLICYGFTKLSSINCDLKMMIKNCFIYIYQYVTGFSWTMSVSDECLSKHNKMHWKQFEKIFICIFNCLLSGTTLLKYALNHRCQAKTSQLHFWGSWFYCLNQGYWKPFMSVRWLK